MKKGVRIFLWILFVALLIELIGVAFISPEVEAASGDVALYKASGVSLLAIWLIGILLELDIFRIKSKLPLIKSEKAMHHLIFWVVLIILSVVFFSLFYNLTSEEFRNAMEEMNASSIVTESQGAEEHEKEQSVQEEFDSVNEEVAEDTLNKNPIKLDYHVTTVFETYNYEIDFSNIIISGYENSDEIEMSFDMKLINNSNEEMSFILPVRLEKAQIAGKDVIEEVTSRSSKSDEGETTYKVDANKSLSVNHVIKCKLLDGVKLSNISERDEINFSFRYAADYSKYKPTYIEEHIMNYEEPIIEEPADFIKASNPAFFSSFDAIDCSGVEITIDQLKVCADLENPKSGYNFYYVVYEYTVKNTSASDTTWRIGKGNSNIYGTFIYDVYERYLGGNQVIKDEDITSTWNNGGILKAGEQKTYSMTLIVDRKMDDPEDGLMLKTDSQMQVVLPFFVGDNEYELKYTLN
ncbi:MAG: hypothetical protein PUC65_00590 [Clostridiales bacterium]|nr:hypothetical protein [Clostridiales bacterium]